jgi:hypothetical protein
LPINTRGSMLVVSNQMSFSIFIRIHS